MKMELLAVMHLCVSHCIYSNSDENKKTSRNIAWEHIEFKVR